MSPTRAEAARPAQLTGQELSERTSALRLALLTGAGELDPSAIDRARRVLDKVGERTTIAGDHTVVALAGATGSGKSSLFNALVGADVATIGARRPTTSTPTAAVWGGGDASELLDWLGIGARHLVSPGPGEKAEGAASLEGLVLLDLPDFDSRELSHRREAERILDLVDVFAWVTDPQKYADARLHDEFVRLLSHHDAVTLAVLNQIDRLSPSAVADCAEDLTRLLAADGVTSPSVLATSVSTGEGIPGFRERLAAAVAGHAAARRRLRADVMTVAGTLRGGVGDTEVSVDRLPRADLDAALGRAAGVPIVLEAVARDYRREAVAHTGWLFSRWTSGFAADPLRRLRLDRTGGRAPIPIDIEGSDVRAVLGRSSIPAPSVSTRSAVDVATRAFVRRASDDLPYRWAQAVHDAASGGEGAPGGERASSSEGAPGGARASSGEGALTDALDQAVVRTPLRARRPAWWLAVNALQWVLGITAVLGLLWLAVLYVVGLMALPRPDTPSVGVIPVPLIMLVLGVLLGIGLAALARWWARIGSRHRRSVIGKRLRASVAAVADECVVEPVAAVLERHRATRGHLDRAARPN